MNMSAIISVYFHESKEVMLMKKRKLLKQSKKLVAVVTAVALLDAPAAYAADGATSETAQYLFMIH